MTARLTARRGTIGTYTAPTGYADTFTGADGSAWSAGWSSVVSSGTNSATIQNNTGRISGDTAFAARAQNYSAMTPVTGIDLTVTVTGLHLDVSAWVIINADTLAISGSPMAQNGYGVQLRWLASSGSTFLICQRAKGNVLAALNSNFSAGLALNTPYKVRIRRVGAVVDFKVWDAAIAEPGAWNFTYTDADPVPAGRIRLAGVAGNATVRQVTFDDMVASV